MDQGSCSFRFNCCFLRRCVGSFVMYRPAVTVLAVSFDGPGAFAGFACCHGKCFFLHNVTLIIGHPESQGWWGQNRQVKPVCFYFMAYALSWGPTVKKTTVLSGRSPQKQYSHCGIFRHSSQITKMRRKFLSTLALRQPLKLSFPLASSRNSVFW